jgi:lysozyme family protein
VRLERIASMNLLQRLARILGSGAPPPEPSVSESAKNLIPVAAFGDQGAPWDANADARFAECVAIVLKHEGGFVDHPADPGGATNHGISLRYARTRGRLFDLDGDGDVDRDDILLVAPDKAAMVYRDWFWRDVKGDDLPAGVDLAAFDYAVNSGPGRAIRSLQRAVGAAPDGFIGPATLGAVRLARPNARAVLDAICDERLAFLRVARNGKTGALLWPTFGRGWQRRVDDVRARARVMAS